MGLFVAAIIESSKEYIVLPVKWIQSVDLFATLKDGVNSAEPIHVFYSPDKTASPNFELPTSLQLKEGPACYSVRIVKFFGE